MYSENMVGGEFKNSFMITKINEFISHLTYNHSANFRLFHIKDFLKLQTITINFD